MKRLIFFVGCFFLMMNCTWAITLECPKIASPGEEFSCHVSDDKYVAIKAKYKMDTGFSYQSLKVNTLFKSYYDGLTGFSVGNVADDSKLSLDFSVKVNMGVAVNREYSISLVEVEGSTLDGKYVKLDDVTSKFQVKADINTLNSLEISNGTLSPKFDKNVLSYKATVDSDKTTIKATLSDSSAKLEGDIGEKKLNYGVNTFSIKVTSSRGNEKVYKLYITRPLKESNNKVVKSSDATIKSLTINDKKIKLIDDHFLYGLDVENEVDDLKVLAIANSKKAKVEIEKPDKLVVGENTVKIKVTAEDGTIATYVVIVNRMKKLSSDATIKSLEVENYDIYFDSEIYEYDLQIDGEDKLNISVILNDENAKYKIKGNKGLKDKSIIEIIVTAEDGSKKTYKININKLGESNSNLISNYIRFIPLVCFIGLIIVVLIVKLLRLKFVKK